MQETTPLSRDSHVHALYAARDLFPRRGTVRSLVGILARDSDATSAASHAPPTARSQTRQRTDHEGEHDESVYAFSGECAAEEPSTLMTTEEPDVLDVADCSSTLHPAPVQEAGLGGSGELVTGNVSSGVR